MLYWILRILIMPFYRLFYHQKVFGKENLPKGENYIIVCNHFAKADAFAMSAIFRKKVYFLSKKEWFNKKGRAWLFHKLGAVPVDRDRADFTSMKNCLKILKKCGNLVIFPEGTRNKTGENLLPIKGGAAFIAFLAKTKIVPMAMNKRFRPFRRNYVYIGKPFDYSEYEGQKFTAELGDVMTEKIKEELLAARAEVLRIYGEKTKK